MALHNKLGNLGEELAIEFLSAKGFEILQLNYRWNHKEIDVICQLNDLIIFVEVKTRSGSNPSNPLDAISNTKIRYLVEAANHYLQVNGIEKESRFDVISIIIDGSNQIVEHIPDAIQPSF